MSEGGEERGKLRFMNMGCSIEIHQCFINELSLNQLHLAESSDTAGMSPDNSAVPRCTHHFHFHQCV